MRSHKETELEIDGVRVTWCPCERCAAVGPRLITLVRNSRAYTSRLQADCCRVKRPLELRDEEWASRSY